MGTQVEERRRPVDEGLERLVAALEERNAQLERALTTRIVIEQAKGVLVERWGLEPDEAFERLRRAARSHRIRVHDLAERVIASRTTPPELEPKALP